jgi:NADH:ubiquinone oxidoreductase subunit K
VAGRAVPRGEAQDTAEVAVGLAIIVALYRLRQTTHVEDLNRMKF